MVDLIILFVSPKVSNGHVISLRSDVKACVSAISGVWSIEKQHPSIRKNRKEQVSSIDSLCATRHHQVVAQNGLRKMPEKAQEYPTCHSGSEAQGGHVLRLPSQLFWGGRGC